MHIVENRSIRHCARLQRRIYVGTCNSRLLYIPAQSRTCRRLFRHPVTGRQPLTRPQRPLINQNAVFESETPTLAFSGSAPKRGTVTALQPSRSARTSGGGDPDPDDEPGTNASFQIDLDPFSQQLVASALTAGGAWGLASWAGLDLSTALRWEPDALAVALPLSAPVLVLLLAVVAPHWAPPYKGTELERLRHNYYMTAQVLRLYLDLDDLDEEGGDQGGSRAGGGEGGGSGGSVWEEGPGGGGERARVRRRLRLEQNIGWGTVSSGLALMQAFTLQPWNPPTANTLFGLGLAGRSVQQLANEFLVRGAAWGLLSSWVAGELSAADASDGILFYGKVFGGPETVKYVAGLALVALALPGALWEARSARNFVRASVVGPVRDAAIFCTGNGVDEPAYCDPAGFAMMAARRPANAAPVADVVIRTRSWRSGPNKSYSSVSSLGSLDLAELEEGGEDKAAASQTNTTTADGPRRSSTTTTAAAGAPAGLPSGSSSPSSSAPAAATAAAAARRSGTSPAGVPGSSNGSSGGGNAESSSGSGAPSWQTGEGSGGSGRPPSLPSVGPTVKASSAAFEWDSEDMGVLLRVETLQDKIAFWSSVYYQLLAAFAINGAFLASDCNLGASFLAAWLLRTGPLLLAELRARRAADAAGRG